MSLELTHSQAIAYLYDLSEVLTLLGATLVKFAILADNTPGGAPPEGMLNSLAECWENCDSRFTELYTLTYGKHPNTANAGATPDAPKEDILGSE